MKKRYIILICIALMLILGSFVSLTKPVRPFIQLPGEVYPGTEGWPILGGLTNTFMSTVVAWIMVAALAFSLKARTRTADEIPTGFYNFFEMIIEAAYNFAEGIAGPKVKNFFPWFMTFILIILTTNWMGLIPGWDSIGFYEWKPHKAALDAEKDAAANGIEFTEEDFHEIEHLTDEANIGDLRVAPLFLFRADVNAQEDAVVEEDSHGRGIGWNPETADWTIVPLLRPGATDLNYTLAFALIAMTMVQYFGFKYLGSRGYLSKFFPFIGKGWGKEVSKNPIKAIDPAVGILELISEISKIISFAFRLLGNIFAGMVLLFVMAYLLPVINVVFFGLEFFVGLIQALVFALLMLIFMVSATESHHGDEEHH
jgi:F-type H+-transporting ATPase subunit a